MEHVKDLEMQPLINCFAHFDYFVAIAVVIMKRRIYADVKAKKMKKTLIRKSEDDVEVYIILRDLKEVRLSFQFQVPKQCEGFKIADK